MPCDDMRLGLPSYQTEKLARSPSRLPKQPKHAVMGVGPPSCGNPHPVSARSVGCSMGRDASRARERARRVAWHLVPPSGGNRGLRAVLLGDLKLSGTLSFLDHALAVLLPKEKIVDAPKEEVPSRT